VLVSLVALPHVAEALTSAGTPAVQSAAHQTTTQAARPYRGLFGAGSAPQSGGHLIDLTASLSQEYGNVTEGDVAPPSLLLKSGWSNALRATLGLQRQGKNAAVAWRTEAGARYYRDLQEFTTPRVRTELGIEAALGRMRRTQLRVGARAEREPYYTVPLLAAAGPAVGGSTILPVSRDDLLFRQQRNIYAVSFSLEHASTPRTFMDVDGSFRLADVAGTTADIRDARVGGRIGRRMTRYLSLRGGYGYRRGFYGTTAAERIESHDIDLLADYRRPLPRARRTTFGFSTGSSVLTAPVRETRLVGSVNLRHEMDRGWFLQGDYVRGVQLIEGFATPFYTDTVSASLGGYAGRRVELLASSGYSRGSAGALRGGFTLLQGAARMRLAVARFLAVDAEGLYYKHDFDEAILALPGLGRRLTRYAVRVNVTVWLPLSR
jgi:hypothetical protein